MKNKFIKKSTSSGLSFLIRKHTPKYSVNIKGWQALREIIIERDNYECRICGKDAGEESLHVHHIDWDRTHNEDNNLVTLCQRCHKQVHVEQYKPCDYPDHPTPWGIL